MTQTSREDAVFLTEACRLWRTLYGGDVAICRVARYFASKVPKAENLRFVAENARRLATELDELADKVESDIT